MVRTAGASTAAHDGVMRAPVCLQGGAEFSAGCEGMDTAMLLAGDGRPRPVLVLPMAAGAGRERQLAAANARRWYLGLGARQVDAVLDEGPPVGAALDRATEQGMLVVLPGGSPQRLLACLLPHAGALRAAVAAGVAVSGASAGAMVLCRWTVLPGSRIRAAPALGLVDVDLVLPHYNGGTGATAWLGAARDVLPADAVVLGLPERSGAVVAPDGELTPTGVTPFSRVAMPG